METMATAVHASVVEEGNPDHKAGNEDLTFTLSDMRRDGWMRGKLAPIKLTLNFTAINEVRSSMFIFELSIEAVLRVDPAASSTSTG